VALTSTAGWLHLRLLCHRSHVGGEVTVAAARWPSTLTAAAMGLAPTETTAPRVFEYRAPETVEACTNDGRDRCRFEVITMNDDAAAPAETTAAAAYRVPSFPDVTIVPYASAAAKTASGARIAAALGAFAKRAPRVDARCTAKVM
jgi:hypothetical protein